MGSRERRQREKLETRDKILEAARELFVRDGYDGVSMRKVAEKIEYSPTTIYLHFADKESLFKELCVRDFAHLARVFQEGARRPQAAHADPAQRLLQAGMGYIQFGAQYPNHYKLMFMTPHPKPRLDKCDDERKGKPELDAYAFLKHGVQQAVSAGVFRKGLDDVELISQTLWAAVHGVISLEIAKKNDSWVDWRPLKRRAELMLDAVMRGLVKKEE
jgi:AcrR family transcriptional regulator